MKLFRTYRAHCARYIPTLNESHICKQMHGHTFNIVVHLEGPIDKTTGFVMDFFDLDIIVDKEIIKKIDHKVLNDINGLENPSSENLAIYIFNNLADKIKYLSKISVSEDHGTGIVYSGK